MSAPHQTHPLFPCDELRSPRARRLVVAAMFSLHRRPAPGRPELGRASRRAADALDALLRPGALSFLIGPSGAGKSSVLRALERRIRQRDGAVCVVKPASLLLDERRAVINLFNRSLDEDIRLLCTLGLAEAPLWLRPAGDLSEGQRWRLSLALAARSALADGGDATLIADEFASTLDRLSAMSLCAGVNRLVRRHPALRIIAASAHEDTAEWLRPDLVMTLDNAFSRNARYTLQVRSRT